MAKITVELVRYDMDKTKKRKRKNFVVDTKSKNAVIEKLEKIHKGEKVQAVHEIVWGDEEVDHRQDRETYTGIIKFYDDVKEFGFIQPDEDIDDLFFHMSALKGQKVCENDYVEFEIGVSAKGDVAIHIQLIES